MKWLLGVATLFALLTLITVVTGFEDTFPATVGVYFSPKGGCTQAVVNEITAAKQRVWVQAYSFTSAPIAKALLEAHRRGVKVAAVLDKSNQTERYSAATLLANAGIPTVIDSEHAIAHNKVIVIDDDTVITGSFNFTKAAEQRNAENLVVIKSKNIAALYVNNIDFHFRHSSKYNR